jgi:hypothetical protein
VPVASRYLVVVLPRTVASQQLNAQIGNQIVPERVLVQWVSAPDVKAAAEQVNVPPGARVFCCQEDYVQRFMRPEVAALVQEDTRG